MLDTIFVAPCESQTGGFGKLTIPQYAKLSTEFLSAHLQNLKY